MAVTRKKQVIECMRAMEDGMFITATADHVSQVDILKLLWWMCKSIYLLLLKEIK